MCGESETKSNSTQVSGPEPWMSFEGRHLYDAALNVAEKNGAMNAYQGPTTADYGSDLDASRGAVQNLANDNSSSQASGSILDQLRALLMPQASQSTQDFMNPYTDAVLAPQLRGIAERGQQARNQIDSRATAAGAFGDAAQGNLMGRQYRDENQAATDATGLAKSNAFDKAQAQKNAVISQLGSLTGLYNAKGAADTSKQSTVAQLFAGLADKVRGVNQTRLDNNKTATYENTDRALRTLSGLMGLLSASPHQTIGSGYQTQTQPDNSGMGLAGSALGALTSGGSAGFAGSALGMLFGLSDERLKKDITDTGAIDLRTGAPSKTWRYLWDDDDAPLRAGPMAQDVLNTRPDLVANIGGVLALKG